MNEGREAAQHRVYAQQRVAFRLVEKGMYRKAWEEVEEDAFNPS